MRLLGRRRRRNRFSRLLVSGLLVLGLVAVTGFAAAQVGLPPGGTFIDDEGNPHEPNIEAIAAAGITLGCNPPANDRYCPRDSVSRAQMASFLVRTFGFPPSAVDRFVDDNGNTHEANINAVAAAGVTLGCNPPANDRFCPNDKVSRAQMASFIARAAGTPPSGTDFFADDNGNTHEANINAIAAAGIAVPCAPGFYCPANATLRDVMATMLARARGLSPIPPPPDPTPIPPPTGEQVPITISRLKDFGSGPVTDPAVVIGEAIKDNGGGEYDFTDGTAVKELELKGDTKSVSLNTCYLIIGHPTGSDLEVTDRHYTDHAVVALGVRCANGIDSF